jgi:hypothetical protein
VQERPIRKRTAFTWKHANSGTEAHARNVRLIGESRKKDDGLDAQALARRARIDPQLLAP